MTCYTTGVLSDSHKQLWKTIRVTIPQHVEIRNAAFKTMLRRGEIHIDGKETSIPIQVNVARPGAVHSESDPTPTRILELPRFNLEKDDASSIESRDTILKLALHTPTLPNTHLSPHSFGTHHHHTPASSRPSSPFGSSRPSRPSITSSFTSATVSVDLNPDLKVQSSEPSSRRPSLLTRLRSSTSVNGAASASYTPSDFQRLPDQPEKHFIDSIGMVIPGVSNRYQCEHPRAHFVSHWRLCEPTEYSTALADHGITYQDYSRLLKALDGFHDEVPNESRGKWPGPSWWQFHKRKVFNRDDPSNLRDSEHSPQMAKGRTMVEREFEVARQQAEDLNRFLEEITCAWRSRNIPVMVCISSYSLFAPNRISEAHIQILHVSLESPTQQEIKNDSRIAARLSFIDPFAVARSEECSVAHPRHVAPTKQRSFSTQSAFSGTPLYHHQQLHFRDRTRPWPLWPNAIPSRKREQMNDNADRYGVDPYFRAWMRANINSRTQCTSYAKYMIEKEDNPFINKRLDYVVSPSPKPHLSGLFGVGSKGKSQGIQNKKHYEHNRRLECRKTIENGSARLRIVRFGFRYAIYPPHTPEMDELGLTQEKYDAIISNIEKIRQHTKPTYYECVPNFVTSLTKIRSRNTVDAINKVSEYVRELNAAGRRIVWTIEKIPSVYDEGLRCDQQEWEISAWNGEDPLELLIQLEKWGIIENCLNIDDDE